MDVIALVYDFKVRIGGREVAGIFSHSHAGRWDAIAGEWATIGCAPHVVAVGHAADLLIMCGIAIGARDSFAINSPERCPTRWASDLPYIERLNRDRILLQTGP